MMMMMTPCADSPHPLEEAERRCPAPGGIPVSSPFCRSGQQVQSGRETEVVSRLLSLLPLPAKRRQKGETAGEHQAEAEVSPWVASHVTRPARHPPAAAFIQSATSWPPSVPLPTSSHFSVSMPLRGEEGRPVSSSSSASFSSLLAVLLHKNLMLSGGGNAVPRMSSPLLLLLLLLLLLRTPRS